MTGRSFRGFSSKRTDVLALNGSSGGTEAQADVLVPSATTLAGTGRLDLGLAVEEDLRNRSLSARPNSPLSCFPINFLPGAKTHCEAASGKRARSARSVR